MTSAGTCARCRQRRDLHARGLCRPCYGHEHLAGKLEDWPRAGREPETLPPYVTAWCGIGGANHASCGLSPWTLECHCPCHRPVESDAGSNPESLGGQEKEGVG